MTRIRRSGNFTAVIDDDKKEISLRHGRPDPGKIVLTGDEEKARAITAMDLEKDIAQGYEILDELAE